MSGYLLSAFVCFSLWDYYIPSLGGRVLDYVGIASLGMLLASRLISPNITVLSFTPAYLALLSVTAPYIVIAYWQGTWLTATAFILGATVIYGSFWTARPQYERLKKQVRGLILINLLFFFFQYASFNLFGVVVDYHSYFGSVDPRTFNVEIDFFRAAGLFQEPNSFCVTLFMLNVLHLILRGDGRADAVLAASIIAMIISESLWGFGAAIVVMGLTVSIRFSVARVAMVAMVLVPIIVLAVSFTEILTLIELILTPVTINRLADFLGDPSIEARYGGLAFKGMLDFLIGAGLSTQEFQSLAGANGLGFFVYCFGLVGFAAFIVWLVADSSKKWLFVTMAVLFAMTSYPLFTYAFWWAWLGILIQAARRVSTEQNSAVVRVVSPASASPSTVV